jgi:hypothetical protein
MNDNNKMTTTVAAASGEASGECCGGVGSHRSRSTKAVKRSAIPDIRKTMLERGALLFMFTKPAGVLHKPEHVRWFEQMQALGFLITTSGCMIPYDNFSGSSKRLITFSANPRLLVITNTVGRLKPKSAICVIERNASTRVILSTNLSGAI